MWSEQFLDETTIPCDPWRETSRALNLAHLLCFHSHPYALDHPALMGRPTAVTPGEIRQAYRSLYKAALLAVQYARPARYMVRSSIRKAFRNSPASDFDRERIANTLRFFNNASKHRGIEHKITKTILHVRYWQWISQREYWNVGGRGPMLWSSAAVQQGYKNIERTIEMLNQTMGMCLK